MCISVASEQLQQKKCATCFKHSKPDFNHPILAKGHVLDSRTIKKIVKSRKRILDNVKFSGDVLIH